jgi:hypothetical protein
MAEMDITAGVVDVLDPLPSLIPPFQWTRFAHYPDPWAAHIVAGLLENEGVATYIESSGIFGDGNSFATLWIPQPLAHRARWILALAPPTETELVYLATGELNSDQQP